MTHNLAQAIARGGALEEVGMHADERTACFTHRTWVVDCADQHLPLTAGRVLAAVCEVDRARGRAAVAHSQP